MGVAKKMSRVKLKTFKAKLKPIRSIGTQKLSGSGF